MQDRTYSGDSRQVGKFWGRFIKIVGNQGVVEPFDRWYVVRAEEYIKAFPDKRLRDHRQEDLVGYLTRIARNTSLKDWQVRQIADALRILLQSPRSDSIDLLLPER